MLPKTVYLIAYEGVWGVYGKDAIHPFESLFSGTLYEAHTWLIANGYQRKGKGLYAKVD